MSYVDGFVLVVPKKKLAIYKKHGPQGRQGLARARRARLSRVRRRRPQGEVGPAFTKLAKTKPGETVVFSYIVYKSRAHRDKVNAKVMADKRLIERHAEGDALRHEAHGLRRLQDAGRGLAGSRYKRA